MNMDEWCCKRKKERATPKEWLLIVLVFLLLWAVIIKGIAWAWNKLFG